MAFAATIVSGKIENPADPGVFIVQLTYSDGVKTYTPDPVRVTTIAQLDAIVRAQLAKYDAVASTKAQATAIGLGPYTPAAIAPTPQTAIGLLAQTLSVLDQLTRAAAGGATVDPTILASAQANATAVLAKAVTASSLSDVAALIAALP